MNAFSAVFTAFFLFFVSGCASVNPAFQALNALLLPAQSLVDRVTEQGGLNPSFVYLHITPASQDPLLAVLGYVDPHSSGPVFVWYAPGGQVLKTQNGRIVGLAGVPQGITNGSFSESLSSWPAAVERISGHRVWDVPLQYRYGVEETVKIQPITASQVPPFIHRHLKRRLGSPDTSVWSWYQQTGSLTGQAWFAIATVAGQQQVVYSYQCLEDGFCLHLATWPSRQGHQL